MKKGEVVDEKCILTQYFIRKRQKLNNLTHSDTDKGRRCCYQICSSLEVVIAGRRRFFVTIICAAVR